jgi:hypothetical protein
MGVKDDEEKAVPQEIQIDYTLRRRGSFQVHVSGPNHCSATPGKNILNYNVTIECKHTDDRGFVFAQEDLQSYFDKITETQLSCEALAAEAAIALHKRISRVLKTKRIRVAVEISPPPYVGSATAAFGNT